MHRYNDEELLYLSRQGCMVAYQALIEEYYLFIRMIYRKMKIQQTKYIDEKEVIQITMVTCIQSFTSYREDRKTKLRTFMSHVIKHSILSVIKKGNREHNRYYAFSLDDNLIDASTLTYEELLADQKTEYQPGKALYVKETKEIYQGYVGSHCSTLEKEVMEYRMHGYSNQDIAKSLQVEVKTIYNAVYRLQKKLDGLK